MNFVALVIAIFTVCFGGFTLLRRQTRLFYKIVVFSAGSYLLAAIYRVLYAALIPVAAFHVGYLAYAGTFLFLLCGFFAEPKETLNNQKNWTKVLACLPALVIIVWGIWNIANGHSIHSQLLLVPVALTAYYALRCLCQPAKLGEYANALRLFHLALLLFCLMQPLMLVAMLTRENTDLPILCHSALLTATVLTAYWGCKRWSI